MKIAILTTEHSAFDSYTGEFAQEIQDMGFETRVFYDHRIVNKDYEVMFVLSYFKIIPKAFLELHKHNIVVHGSDLPNGKGWSPITWKVLEGLDRIPMTLFEVNENVDDGDVYLRDDIKLTGYELNSEIKHIVAVKSIEMCLKFLRNYNRIHPQKQIGSESFYRRRTTKDSELDITKSIAEQFNLLRTVDNNNYPAFFVIDGHKYTLKIEGGLNAIS